MQVELNSRGNGACPFALLQAAAMFKKPSRKRWKNFQAKIIRWNW